MWTIRRIMWVLILCTSLPVFIYITLTEGFIEGKAYMMLLACGISVWGIGPTTLMKYFSKSKKS